MLRILHERVFVCICVYVCGERKHYITLPVVSSSDTQLVSVKVWRITDSLDAKTEKKRKRWSKAERQHQCVSQAQSSEVLHKDRFSQLAELFKPEVEIVQQGCSLPLLLLRRLT